MPIHNDEIAGIFNRVADLLAIRGANLYRIRAYRTAARTTGKLSCSLADMVETGSDLTALPEIGKDLSERIEEVVRTGSLAVLEKLEDEIPPGLLELLQISGLGPRKVRVLYRQLGIHSLEELEEAVKEHRVRRLARFGVKTEQNIVSEIARLTGRSSNAQPAKGEQITEPPSDCAGVSKKNGPAQGGDQIRSRHTDNRIPHQP